MRRSLIALGLGATLMLGLASTAAGYSITGFPSTDTRIFVDPAGAGVIHSWMNPDRYDSLVEAGILPARYTTATWINPDRYDSLVEAGILP